MNLCRRGGIVYLKGHTSSVWLYILKAFPDVVGESVLPQKQDGKVDA